MGRADAFSNILTVDVEDWFHILEVDGGFTRRDWDGLESRVERNTDRLLEWFDEAGAGATFFIVGWVAERFPGLVRRIADAGHEIGSHSYWHEVLPRHDAGSFASDIGYARKLLEEVSGCAVRGFRAPGASIVPEVAWVFDLMLEQGYTYDASLCPGYSSHGGYPSEHFGPHRVRCRSGELFEIPSSTTELVGRRICYAGGGYLRLFPYAWLRRCVARDNAARIPANVYLHPREIDPSQPRMPLPAWRRFKYYVGLHSTERKVRGLLRDFRWVSAGSWLEAHGESLATGVLDVREAAAGAVPDPDPALIPPRPSAAVVRSRPFV